MPEQLSNPKRTRARQARRRARSASLPFAAAMTLAAWCAPVADAQRAPQPGDAPASARKEAVRPGDAKAKATGARGEKPARPSTSEITRARRAAAPPASTTPSPASPASRTTAPPATPSPAAPAATHPPASPAASASPAPPATRTATPKAVPSAAPKAAQTAAPKAAPSAAPAVVAPVAAPSIGEAAASAPGSAASKSKVDAADVERLRAEIKDAQPGAERARLQRALVERLVALKREPEALDTLRLMIHEDRYDPAFFFNTGNALARLGDASAAEDAYRKAILQRRGNYSRALNNLGVILIRQGHWDEAHETLSAALVQENYAYAEASYNLGRLHLLRGEADLAIREWLRTLRLEPAHAEAAAALARAYTEDGDAERGIIVLDNFAARATRTGAGVPREIAEARRELVAARDEPPAARSEPAAAAEDADAANAKTGLAGRDLPRAARAGAKLRRAHEIDRPTYDLLRTARAARESGSPEEAVKHYRGVLQRSPGGYFPPANLELGAALMNLKRYEEAIAVLLSLTQKDAARYPVAHYYLGRLYERQGQLALSADSFRRAAELYGDTNPQVLIELSRLREQTGDPAGALAAMNDYAAALGRQGTVPAWVGERQAKLRQKAAASTASSAPENQTPTRQ